MDNVIAFMIVVQALLFSACGFERQAKIFVYSFYASKFNI